MRATIIGGASILLLALVGCEESGKGVEAAEVSAPELQKFIQDQKGKVVLIDCWALWCPPCVRNFPHFVETHDKFADKGLVCVSLNMDKFYADRYNQEKVLAFLKRKRAAFPNFIAEPIQDQEGLLKLIGDYSTIPYQVMFDRSGQKVWANAESPLSERELDQLIERELAKP